MAMPVPTAHTMMQKRRMDEEEWVMTMFTFMIHYDLEIFVSLEIES